MRMQKIQRVQLETQTAHSVRIYDFNHCGIRGYNRSPEYTQPRRDGIEHSTMRAVHPRLCMLMHSLAHMHSRAHSHSFVLWKRNKIAWIECCISCVLEVNVATISIFFLASTFVLALLFARAQWMISVARYSVIAHNHCATHWHKHSLNEAIANRAYTKYDLPLPRTTNQSKCKYIDDCHYYSSKLWIRACLPARIKYHEGHFRHNGGKLYCLALRTIIEQNNRNENFH